MLLIFFNNGVTTSSVACIFSLNPPPKRKEGVAAKMFFIAFFTLAVGIIFPFFSFPAKLVKLVYSPLDSVLNSL